MLHQEVGAVVDQLGVEAHDGTAGGDLPDAKEADKQRADGEILRYIAERSSLVARRWVKWKMRQVVVPGHFSYATGVNACRPPNSNAP